jgi:hypothetical protein
MKLEPKRTIQRINGTKYWFSKKVNKIDKPLADVTRRSIEKAKLIK